MLWSIHHLIAYNIYIPIGAWLKAVMFVVIVLFVHQYCRWNGLWSASNMWKIVCHRMRCRKLTDGWNFYYCPHSSHIDGVSYSNTQRYSDLNDVLTVCLWWVLDIVMNAQILGVDATPRFLLVNLLTKTLYAIVCIRPQRVKHVLCFKFSEKQQIRFERSLHLLLCYSAFKDELEQQQHSLENSNRRS
jgi:hypothetical protein